MIFKQLTEKDIERLSPELVKKMIVHMSDHGYGHGLTRHQRGPCHHCKELMTHVRRQLALASVGWFGVPGSAKYSTKTHAVIGGKPVCGARLHPKSEFQHCAPNTDHYDPECGHCKNWLRRTAKLKAA